MACAFVSMYLGLAGRAGRRAIACNSVKSVTSRSGGVCSRPCVAGEVRVEVMRKRKHYQLIYQNREYHR